MEQNVPKQCKTTVDKVCFKLILMYDTKTWTLSKEREENQAMGMTFLRSTEGRARRERVRNEI
jgi:hypothetical protein